MVGRGSPDAVAFPVKATWPRQAGRTEACRGGSRVTSDQRFLKRWNCDSVASNARVRATRQAQQQQVHLRVRIRSASAQCYQQLLKHGMVGSVKGDRLGRTRSSGGCSPPHLGRGTGCRTRAAVPRAWRRCVRGQGESTSPPAAAAAANAAAYACHGRGHTACLEKGGRRNGRRAAVGELTHTCGVALLPVTHQRMLPLCGEPLNRKAGRNSKRTQTLDCRASRRGEASSAAARGRSRCFP